MEMSGFTATALHRFSHLLICCLLAAASAAAGCAGSQYSASVSALAAAGSEPARKYVLVPGDKDVKAEDLQFQEYAAYVDRAMSGEGFVRATSDQDADLVLAIFYGIGNPQQHEYSYAIPHYGQTGVSSATTYGNFSTYGGYGTYSGTTYYQPTYGVTGYSTGSSSYLTFTRVLGLFALDAASIRTASEPRELWRVSVASVGGSGDLRKVMPFMVAAAKPYLGKATPGKSVTVNMGEADKRISDIRDGPPAPAGMSKEQATSAYVSGTRLGVVGSQSSSTPSDPIDIAVKKIQDDWYYYTASPRNDAESYFRKWIFAISRSMVRLADENRSSTASEVVFAAAAANQDSEAALRAAMLAQGTDGQVVDRLVASEKQKMLSSFDRDVRRRLPAK